MTAAEIAQALGGGKELATGGYSLSCPAHDDKHPSLSIADGAKGPLVHCHAGCTQEAVIRALQDRGAWPKHDDSEIPIVHAQLGRYSQHWDYHDSAGVHVLRVCRWDVNGRKEIRPLSFQAGRWIWKQLDSDRPLYRLPALLADKSNRVLLVEGEKTADAAQKYFPNLIVTTWAGGAKAISKTDWRSIAGRDVTSFPDNDKPGRTAMDVAEGILRSHGCTVRRADVSKLGDLPEGWDIADARGDRDFDIDALAQVVEGAAVVSSPDDPDDSALPKIQLLGFTTAELLEPIMPERYLLPDLVPTESYSLIAGALSSYKSTLLHYLGLWRATGFDLLDLDPDGPGCDIGPALIIVYEDSDRRFKSRTQRIVQHAYAKITSLHGKRSAAEFLARVEKNFRRVVLTGQVGATLVCRGPSGIILPNQPLLDKLLAAAHAFTASNLLIGIDPLRLAITGSQNDDDGADIVVHVLNNLAMSLPDSGIVICSHTTKSGAKEEAEGYTAAAYSTSGSALYSQHARSNFLISRIPAKKASELLDVDDIGAAELETQPIAKLTHGRLSHGGESPDRYFRNTGGALAPVALRTARTTAIQIHDAARVIIAAMQRLAEQGVNVTGTSLLSDTEVLRLGKEKRIRQLIKMSEENGYIEFTGSTKDRNGVVTAKGRLALETNGNES